MCEILTQFRPDQYFLVCPGWLQLAVVLISVCVPTELRPDQVRNMEASEVRSLLLMM